MVGAAPGPFESCVLFLQGRGGNGVEFAGGKRVVWNGIRRTSRPVGAGRGAVFEIVGARAELAAERRSMA